MTMDEIDTDRIDSLYRLYAAECDREKTVSKLDEFEVWGVENGYWDD